MNHSISSTISTLKLVCYEMNLVQDNLHSMFLNRLLIYSTNPKTALGPREFIEFVQCIKPLGAPNYVRQTHEIIKFVII